MFDVNTQTNDVFALTDALAALGDLEANNSQAILKQRSSERMVIRTRVRLQPGNSSQRHTDAIDGLTGDISNGGTLVLLPRPVLAGDTFWVTFSNEHVSIGSLLARCTRCRMVREDTFEIGLRFFHDIDLASAANR